MKTKLTKIVATLGPASDSEETIEKLINAGVNVFRFNTKHGTTKWHEERIQRVQKVADQMKISIGILLDLQGPELRIETPNQEDLTIERGEIFFLSTKFLKKSKSIVIPHRSVIRTLKKDDEVLIDDGRIILNVTSTGISKVKVKVIQGSLIKNRKGVNLPGKKLNMPSLVEADHKQLDMATINKVDFIALSFVRNKKDIDNLKKEMVKRNLKAKVIVKTENQQSLDNIDSLIEESDGIMLARGDLGVEVPIEKLSYWQKEILKKCRKKFKPVITATEMLASMENSSVPTRAEATDVSNAVFDGTCALMLSGETASGNFPITAVKTMTKIAAYAESVKKCKRLKIIPEDQTQMIGYAAMQMLLSQKIKVDKIIVFTQTGYTANVISSFRPNVQIVAVTNNQQTVENLTLTYGVTGYKYHFPKGEMVSPNYIVDKLVKKKIVSEDDSILVIHGARWKKPGLTNSITLVAN